MNNGDIVKVKVHAIRGPIDLIGFSGVVVLTDEKAGVCVALDISPIYEPCFWVDAVNLEEGERVSPTPLMIEESLGGRGPVKDDLIGHWMLKSWMVLRTKTRPGSTMCDKILGATHIELLSIYADPTEGLYTEWVKANSPASIRSRSLIIKSPDTGKLKVRR